VAGSTRSIWLGSVSVTCVEENGEGGSGGFLAHIDARDDDFVAMIEGEEIPGDVGGDNLQDETKQELGAEIVSDKETEEECGA